MGNTAAKVLGCVAWDSSWITFVQAIVRPAITAPSQEKKCEKVCVKASHCRPMR